MSHDDFQQTLKLAEDASSSSLVSGRTSYIALQRWDSSRGWRHTLRHVSKSYDDVFDCSVKDKWCVSKREISPCNMDVNRILVRLSFLLCSVPFPENLISDVKWSELFLSTYSIECKNTSRLRKLDYVYNGWQWSFCLSLKALLVMTYWQTLILSPRSFDDHFLILTSEINSLGSNDEWEDRSR